MNEKDVVSVISMAVMFFPENVNGSVACRDSILLLIRLKREREALSRRRTREKV